MRAGGYRKAIEYHGRPGDRGGGGGPGGGGRGVRGLGSAHDSLGDYRKAIEYHGQALAIAVEVGDRAGEGSAYNNMAAAQLDSGQSQEAAAEASRAVEVYAKLEREVDDQALRMSLFAEQVKIYDILQSALLATGRRSSRWRWRSRARRGSCRAPWAPVARCLSRCRSTTSRARTSRGPPPGLVGGGAAAGAAGGARHAHLEYSATTTDWLCGCCPRPVSCCAAWHCRLQARDRRARTWRMPEGKRT